MEETQQTAQPPVRRLMRMVAIAITSLFVAAGVTLVVAAPAQAVGGPEVQWSYANGSYTLTLPASDPTEVKQIVPSQHIFCGDNYQNPCASSTYTLPAEPGACVMVQVDWNGRHDYNSDDYRFCAPTTPEEPQPEPTCVVNPTWSYTFDGVRSGTVTASSETAKPGDLLCDPLAVRASTFTYDLPAEGSPSWPQTLKAYNDVTVDRIGSVSYEAPAEDSCRQHDIAAEFASKGGFDALKVPDKLLGPNNPYEPPFLHDTLKGMGPNPTWSFTSSEGCNTPPPPTPEVTTGQATFTVKSCVPGTDNTIDAPAAPGGVVTLTDKDGKIFTTKVGEGYTGGIPEGLAYGPIEVTRTDGSPDDLYEFTPWSGTWTPVDPATLDCRTADAVAVVTVVGEPTCDTAAKLEFFAENAKWDGKPVPTDEPNTFTQVVTANEGSVFLVGDKRLDSITVEYVVTPSTGVYQSEDASKACYKKPETPKPEEPKPEKPSVEQPPAHKPAHNSVRPGATGDATAPGQFDNNSLFAAGGLSTLLLAVGAMMFVRKHRSRTSNKA